MANKSNKNNQASKPNLNKDAREEKELMDIEQEIAQSRPLPLDSEGAEVSLSAEELVEADTASVVQVKNVWIKAKQKLVAWEQANKLLVQDKELVKKERDELAAEKTQLHEKLKSYNDELVTLTNLRLSFEIDFEDVRTELLSSAEAAAESIMQEARSIRDKVGTESHELLLKAQRESADLVSQNQIKEIELKKRENELQSREEQLREAQLKLEEKESHKLARAEERYKQKLDELSEENQDLRNKLERRASQVKTLSDEVKRFGGNPEDVQAEISRLNQENSELKDQLSQRPPASDIEELRAKAGLAADALLNTQEWQRKYFAVAQQLENQQIPALGLESLRDQKQMLQAEVETLRQVIDKNRQDWEELQEKSTAAEPFPACSGFDRDVSLSRPSSLREISSLKTLAEEVRIRMAQGEPQLYYSESDVRLFLGGLAASRLHLLQGISGTGKTSLPQSFFQAIGGQDAATIIEVQAGWRDQDDLFGYYNAFEKRYVESEFTKALYRALLPANQDRAMVIILDEMNLSHPEQYFGSMLSILEKPKQENRKIALLSSSLPGLPDKILNGQLSIAQNVWFVGTANHDETTVAFADKTYDRSHVQELPDQYLKFKADRKVGGDPISYEALQEHFSLARDTHKVETQSALDLLNGNLRSAFAKVGVGWGSRLERQLKSFIPVVIDAGGTATEALDHLVATRLLRKVVDRFDIRADDLGKLLDEIEVSWKLGQEKPIKSIEKLQNSMTKMSRDG